MAAHAQPAKPEAAANGEAPAPPEPAKPETEVISLTEIGVRSEKSKSRAAEALASLAEKKESKRLAAQLPEQEKEVSALEALSADVRESNPNLIQVDQLRQEWRARFDALDAIQAELGSSSAELARSREALSKDRAVWQATADAARASGEEESVQDQIESVLVEIDRALEAIKARQANLSGLQGRVAGLSEAARADFERLAEIRRTLVGRVFERDRIPMTSPEFFQLLSAEEMEARLAEHREREIAALWRFGEQHRDRLIVHGLATLVLLLLTFVARSRVRRFHAEHADRDPEIEHMEAVFDRPISLALLLSLFAGLWGYDEIPPLASPVVGLTALLPAVLILRGLVSQPVRPVLYVLLVLFFVQQVNQAVAPLPGLPRLIFISEMLVVFVLVLWWRRPSRLTDVPLSRQHAGAFRALALGLRIALFTTPAAIAAEISGYTALARLLGGTVLTAGYAGMMLYGSVVAVDGVVAFLLAVRPFNIAGMVRRHAPLLASYAKRGVRWVAALLFVWVLLNRLEIVDQVQEAFVAFWNFEIPLIAVEITFGSIIEFGLIVWLTFLISRFVRFTLEEEVYTRVRMRKGQPYAITTLTHYVVLTLGFLLAIFALGLDVNRFTVLAGAFGVGIGFGLQTVVNNFVSGLILLTEQPVQVGDTVELEGVFGEVQRIGIRSSTVRTWQGAEVIVPNAQLVSEQVTNWTLSDQRRRMELPVGVAYGSDPGLVISILERAARSNEYVLSDPAPIVLFVAFGDSALDFELRCWTDRSDIWLSVKSALMVEIEASLRAADITIPFPQRDLHLRSVEPDVAATLGSGPGSGESDTGDDAAGDVARARVARPAPMSALRPNPSAAIEGDDGE